jgi:L-amino acid N-acyltransferase YncA
LCRRHDGESIPEFAVEGRRGQPYQGSTPVDGLARPALAGGASTLVAEGVMGLADYEIAPATRDDIAGILDLQDRNLRRNGGALSVAFSAAWFEIAVDDMPVIVVRRAGRVVGYVVSTPLAAQAHDPIIQGMLRAYPGAHGAYNYGPICVAEDERGRGLAGAMFAALRQRLPAREGFTFIRRDNTVSLQVHAKMGMRQVAEFTHAGAGYVVVAYVG